MDGRSWLESFVRVRHAKTGGSKFELCKQIGETREKERNNEFKVSDGGVKLGRAEGGASNMDSKIDEAKNARS